MIGHMPNLRLDDPDDEEKLLEYLRRYRARTGHSLTVIFDPGQAYRPGQKLKRGGITVQFVSPGQTADQMLVRRLRKIRNPQAVIVVTSDRAVEGVARLAGIRVMPAQEFARQLSNLDTSTAANAENRANLKLSPGEVDEWLAIFSQRKT